MLLQVERFESGGTPLDRFGCRVGRNWAPALGPPGAARPGSSGPGAGAHRWTSFGCRGGRNWAPAPEPPGASRRQSKLPCPPLGGPRQVPIGCYFFVKGGRAPLSHFPPGLAGSEPEVRCHQFFSAQCRERRAVAVKMQTCGDPDSRMARDRGAPVFRPQRENWAASRSQAAKLPPLSRISHTHGLKSTLGNRNLLTRKTVTREARVLTDLTACRMGTQTSSSLL